MAFADFKNRNHKKILDSNPFFMVGEVYGYNIGSKKFYDFGDKKVNYFENGFSSLINFSFPYDAKMGYEELFSKYSNNLNSDLKGNTVMNYISSHDDGNPFDKKREKSFESATKLLLAPGISQTYYGDESARSLDIEETKGDATLRSIMNWEELKTNSKTKEIAIHWQKLSNFRKNHLSIGAGIHTQISSSPYVFSRTFVKENIKDAVIVGLDLPIGNKEISVGTIFKNGNKVKDSYSGKTGVVKNGKVKFETAFNILLIEKL
jgi:alpha-amylase